MLFKPSQQGSRGTFSPALPTAREKLARASTSARPGLKKYRLEHDTAPFSSTEPWLAHMPRPAPVPRAGQWLNQVSPYATAPMTGYARANPTSFAAFPPGDAQLNSSKYNYLSTEKRGPQDKSAGLPMSKQRSDQVLFISNAPTLPLDLCESGQEARDCRTLTRLGARQHPLARTVTDWYAFARRQSARQAFSRLKNPRYRTASLIGVSLVALMFIALLAQGGLINRAGNSFKTSNATNTPPLASATMSSTTSISGSGQQTPIPQLTPVQQPTPTSQPTPIQQPTPTRQKTPAPQPTPPPRQPPVVDASKALVRISQLDPGQYASTYDYNIWAYSTCSSAAMTEVFNAYGRHYRIADVLQVENRIGEITPDQGLLENVGIARTAKKFGFKTRWGNDWTLSRVLSNANAGHPVIVGWPPDRYPDGHIVVVTGGDASHVYIADSSIWNRHKLSLSQFLRWWGGFAAVVTPE